MMNYNVASVSGGKDSTALALLMIERGAENPRFVTADTGHEHPQTYEYLEYLDGVLRERCGQGIQVVKYDFTDKIAGKRRFVETKWREKGVAEHIVEQALEALKPTGIPFLDLVIWKGRFPSRKAQFCTEFLKRDAIDQQLFQPLLSDPDTDEVWSWQGIRADESESRKDKPEQEELDNGIIVYRPLIRWTAADVFDFHRKHGVKWNPLYEQGMGRVGCMPCINCTKGELQEIDRRFPEVIERVAEWERLASMASKRGAATFFCAVTDPMAKGDTDVNHETHGIRRMVEWSQTARGGRQFDLIASTKSDVGCASAYGLCEVGDKP